MKVSMSKNVATFVKDVSEDFVGQAELFKVDPPIGFDMDYETNKNKKQTSYVIVFAAMAFSPPETYIFPATPDGKIENWMELAGSFKGELDIKKALANADYTPVYPKERN